MKLNARTNPTEGYSPTPCFCCGEDYRAVELEQCYCSKQCSRIAKMWRKSVRIALNAGQSTEFKTNPTLRNMATERGLYVPTVVRTLRDYRQYWLADKVIFSRSSQYMEIIAYKQKRQLDAS